MTSELTLEEAVALSLRRTFADAFPGVQVVSWDAPEERERTFISFRIDNGGENPIGTNIHDINIAIRSRNLDAQQREIFRGMLGSAHSARCTLEENNKGKFVMPRGQAVELVAIEHETENQTDRIISATLNASIQPI
jgi:hypothetical protein